MSRIVAVDPNAASPAVKRLLDGVQRGLGATPNLFRVAGQSAAALEAMTSFFGAVTKGALDARARESVALAVSEDNACDYCLSAHTYLGQGAGLSEAEIAAARNGRADEPRRAAMLALARAVVAHRGRVGAALEDARHAGLTDTEVVEVVANVALTIFTNYLNELAGTDIDFPVVRHHAR